MKSLRQVTHPLLIIKGIHFGRHFGRLSVALSASREIASLVINVLIDFKGVNEIAMLFASLPAKSGTSYETAMLFASLMRSLR